MALLFLRLALETGARHNELLQLRLEDLRDSSGVLVFKPKGFHGKYLDSPVTADLFDALVEFVWTRSPKRPVRATPILTYKDGRPISRRYFENLCARVREEILSLNAGEPDYFSTHGLRHTAGTLVQRVAGDAVARRFLGHSPQGRSHIERYSKATIDEVRGALVAIWGVPLAGSGHGWGRDEDYFTRQAELQQIRQARKAQEDWELAHEVTEEGLSEPSPQEIVNWERDWTESLDAEERILERLFKHDA